MEGKKCPKTFFKVLERQNMQSQAIFDLYTDNNKSRYSSNPKDKKALGQLFSCEIYEISKNTFFIQHFQATASDTKQASTVAPTEFPSRIPNRKKISNEHFNLCEAEISLDEIIKSINSEANNNSSGNDSLTAEFYKHFSHELSPVLLDVYDSWRKLGTMGITPRTGIILIKYKKGDKKIL